MDAEYEQVIYFKGREYLGPTEIPSSGRNALYCVLLCIIMQYFTICNLDFTSKTYCMVLVRPVKRSKTSA